MNFWAGFFCGIVSAYVLSFVVLVVMLRCFSRSKSPDPEESLPDVEAFVSSGRLVSFTHVSDIGASVRGYDD